DDRDLCRPAPPAIDRIRHPRAPTSNRAVPAASGPLTAPPPADPSPPPSANDSLQYRYARPIVYFPAHRLTQPLATALLAPPTFELVSTASHNRPSSPVRCRTNRASPASHRSNQKPLVPPSAS